jgi:diguanylate cyclase (GGDEF)-like protein
LCILDNQENPYSQRIRDLLERFRDSIQLSLRRIHDAAVEHSRLHRLADIDPLTGAYNRRSGSRRLHEEFTRAVRTSSFLGVLMLDIDFFKQVNDTHGHVIGDRILMSTSAVVRSLLRESDVLFRYGGDEFAAVITAGSDENLRSTGERLLRAIEVIALPESENEVHFTVSIGGASYPNQHVEDAEMLVRLADEALYRAKDAGRNRVVILK